MYGTILLLKKYGSAWWWNASGSSEVTHSTSTVDAMTDIKTWYLKKLKMSVCQC